VLYFAQQKNLESVQIAMYPKKYASEIADTIHSVLLQHYFQVWYQDQTALMEVNDTKLEEKMHRGEKHKLNKAQKAGFVVEQLADYMLPLVYPLIVAARQAKGYPITLQQTQLEELLQTFPQQYRLFGVWSKNSELIATAVCVQVHSNILYTFYIGDLPQYRSYSPVVLLHQGIYDYCRHNNIHLLDLGIGTEKGILNAPLMQFKQNLGAIISPKTTYIYRNFLKNQ
jgi:lipid II:glycine glycyltransferase (peptidoglycan interpeptide bridge formation enzyme)